MTLARPDWLRDQAQRFEALADHVVVGWRGVELAILEGDDDPVFTDPRAPFSQFTFLEVSLDARARWLIETYQDEAEWGLWLTDRQPRWDGRDGIQRTVFPDLPTGPIEAVRVVHDSGMLAEVTLTIAGRKLLLIAGETSENWDGGFDLLRFDESVLVFADPTVADRLDWRPARPPRADR